jgi:hypothetical protein
MPHSTQREDTHPNVNNEEIVRVETFEAANDPQLIDAPDVDALSSQKGREANEILTELVTQIRFLGTCILALGELDIMGATLSIPTADVMAPSIIPETISSDAHHPQLTNPSPISPKFRIS